MKMFCLSLAGKAFLLHCPKETKGKVFFVAAG
jgi:hypothetical protein